MTFYCEILSITLRCFQCCTNLEKNSCMDQLVVCISALKSGEIQGDSFSVRDLSGD